MTTDQAPGQTSPFPADSFLEIQWEVGLDLKAGEIPPLRTPKPVRLEAVIPISHPIAGDNTGPATIVWQTPVGFVTPILDSMGTTIGWILDMQIDVTFDSEPENPGSCTIDADCDDDDVCTCEQCTPFGCEFATVLLYGDVSPQPCGNGAVDVDDILCALSGFGDYTVCPGADIWPCTGNGLIDVDDILQMLAAFGGASAPECGC